MPATRDEIIAEAREWIGTRWRHQGRYKGRATDCIGLIIGVADQLDLWHFDHQRDRQHLAYPRKPDPKRMKGSLDKFFIPILIRNAGRGDFVWLTVEGEPMHTAIITGEGTLIHAWWELGCVVEQPLSEWRGQWRGAYRFPKLVEG